MVLLRFNYGGSAPNRIHHHFAQKLSNVTIDYGRGRAVVSISELTRLAMGWITEGKCTFAAVTLMDGDRQLKISTRDIPLEYDQFRNQIVEFVKGKPLPELAAFTEKR